MTEQQVETYIRRRRLEMARETFQTEFIAASIKFELVRCIACLADIHKIHYFVRIDNIGVAGSR